MHNAACFPSAEQLRPKAGKTMVASRVAGHSPVRTGQPWFYLFAAQMPVRQRSLSDEKRFWLLLSLQIAKQS